MKKYIILTPSITNIGGAQIYTKNKMLFLKDKGWEVDIFSFNDNPILIEELKPFKKNIIKDLFLPSYITPQNKKKLIINKIIKDEPIDRLVIESHNVNLAFWGELIASKYWGKHFIFLLSESFNIKSQYTLAFLDFKHKRKELAGITKQSLPILFRNYKKIQEKETYFLRAICTNSVKDIENSVVNSIKKADINIGCITRLEKSYVNSLIEEVIVFCNNNKNLNIKLIFYGGAKYPKFANKIKKMERKIENLKITVTGFLYPIPKKIFEITDAFIGVAGAARVSVKEGKLTITLDRNTHKPIGLLGLNTNDNLYSTEENKQSLSNLLQDILIEKKLHLKKLNFTLVSDSYDFKKEFIKHLDFINSSEDKTQYFEGKTNSIEFSELLKLYIMKIIGLKMFKKVSYWKMKLKKK